MTDRHETSEARRLEAAASAPACPRCRQPIARVIAGERLCPDCRKTTTSSRSLPRFVSPMNG